MPATPHKLPAHMEHLLGLRLNDLVAKVAKVTLKDTTRVLLALDTIADFMDCESDFLLDQQFVVDKPTPAQAEMCNTAHNELREYLAGEGDPNWLEEIKAID